MDSFLLKRGVCGLTEEIVTCLGRFKMLVWIKRLISAFCTYYLITFLNSIVYLLFRPCAMVAPDIELICEIMLVAEGFVDARSLARKFITLYALCRELLSKQVRRSLLLLFLGFYTPLKQLLEYRCWVIYYSNFY